MIDPVPTQSLEKRGSIPNTPNPKTIVNQVASSEDLNIKLIEESIKTSAVLVGFSNKNLEYKTCLLKKDSANNTIDVRVLEDIILSKVGNEIIEYKREYYERIIPEDNKYIVQEILDSVYMRIVI